MQLNSSFTIRRALGMDKSELTVLALGDLKSEKSDELAKKVTDSGFNFEWIQSQKNCGKDLDEVTNKVSSTNSLVLVIWDLSKVSFGNLSGIIEKYEKIGGNLIFSASAHFNFDHEQLFYFYWKHYPRYHDRYNYLDGSVMIGSSADIVPFLQDVLEKYPEAAGDTSLHTLFSRYYADWKNGCFDASTGIQLDHGQEIFASTRLSAKKVIKNDWRYEFIYVINEKKAYYRNKEALKFPLNVCEKDGSYFHEIMQTRPFFLICEKPREKSASSLLRNLQVHLKTSWQLNKINRINKGHERFEEVFRFTPTKLPN